MGSWKREAELGAGDLPQLLRRLAEVLERGPHGAGLLEDLPVGALRKLVLVAETEAGVCRVKLKAKQAGEVRVRKAEAKGQTGKPAGGGGAARPAADRERAREKYRQLKKAMQADYKALKKAAEAGQLPAQDVLESFLALTQGMAEMEQPGGDAASLRELARANAAFVEDAQALRRACSARDAAALAEALSRLERRKSACHAQFR